MAEPVRGDAPVAAAEPGAARTLLVALAVCSVCSLVVTTSVVLLRPYQAANQQREREARIAALVAGLPGVSDVPGAADTELDLRVVERETGAYAPDLDATALLERPEGERERVALASGDDPAGVGAVPRHLVVYELRRGDGIETAILPIHGQGYQSTLRGYLAVAGDGDTVRGITFTEHGETPGLGAEVESAAWQARWAGRRIHGPDGEVRIRVVQEPPGPAESPWAVQGLSGATVTSHGVSALVRFWVGPHGFGPYLERLRSGADAAPAEPLTQGDAP